MKNPFRPQPVIETTPAALEPVRISLWGPVGAGKTCLVYALAQELEHFHNRALGDITKYDLQHDNGLKVLPKAGGDRPLGNKKAEDYGFQFVRRLKENDLLIAEHSVRIHDDYGLSTLLTGAEDTPVSQEEYDSRIRELNVARSDGMLAFLDIDCHNSAPSAPDKGILASDEAYCQYVKSLIRTFASPDRVNRSKKYLGVCVSKVDFHPKLLRDPDDLLEVFFPKTDELLKAHNGRDELVIRNFQTSAVGFLPNGQPNYDPDTGWLLSEPWDPFNAAAPLFWIFGEIEKTRAANPIPYPKDRPRTRRWSYWD